MNTFQCRYGCGTRLHINPTIKTKTGKLIPVQENEIPHNCHLSPYFRRNGRVMAKKERFEGEGL
jgi:hypothetical protein